MDQTEFKKTFVALYSDYKKAVAKRWAEIEKDDSNNLMDLPPTFDGFILWLETGDVQPKEQLK